MIDDRTDRFDIGENPPLVSHSTTASAPAIAAASGLQAELGVAFEAVEVFGIEEHPLALGDQVLDRIGHHRHTLVEGGLQRLGDVLVPALPDVQTTSVPAATRFVRVGSLSTLPFARRVEPNATKVDVDRSSSVLARSKNSSSFRLAPGQPPSMNATPRRCGLRRCAAVDRQRNALQLTSVAEGRVVDVDLGGPGRIVDSAAVDDGHDASSFRPIRSFCPARDRHRRRPAPWWRGRGTAPDDRRRS